MRHPSASLLFQGEGWVSVSHYRSAIRESYGQAVPPPAEQCVFTSLCLWAVMTSKTVLSPERESAR